MIAVPQSLLDFIQEGTSFIVAGHEDPDGDCIGSQLAMASLLRRLGKQAIACSAGPFRRPETKPFERCFVPCTADKDTRLIIVDCSARERLGNLPIDGLAAAVIDHHASANPWGSAVYLDTTAPSVTFMVENIFRALKMDLLEEEAQLLLFGFCTDTGFFRHLDKHSSEAFNTTARLIAAGASPKKTFAAMNGGKSLNSRLLLGTVLAKTKPYYGGRLLCSSETLEESQQFNLESRDSDMLYQLLQSIEGVEAMVLIRQENAHECTLGLRSRNSIDVSAVAQRFGGGGHKNAAGAKISGSIAELEARIVAAFAPWFSAQPW